VADFDVNSALYTLLAAGDQEERTVGVTHQIPYGRIIEWVSERNRLARPNDSIVVVFDRAVTASSS